MRRVDYLITSVREIARNSPNPDSTVGILDNTIVGYLNAGQQRLASRFLGLKNVQRPFLTEKTISIVAGTESYAVPDRMAMSKHIHQVMYSATSQLQDYLLLQKLQPFNRILDTSPYPIGYWVANGSIFLTPVPSASGGSLRVLYDRALDQMGKRAGIVSAVSAVGSVVSSITLGQADESSTPNLSTIDYICVVDGDGEAQTYNIPVGSYDTGTNILTPTGGSFTVPSGESVPAIGDYVTLGRWTTTHGQLPDDCESYLVQYAAKRCLSQDSSNDSMEADADLIALEQAAIDAFKAQSGEIHFWPTLNYNDW